MSKERLEVLLKKHFANSCNEREKQELSIMLQSSDYDNSFISFLDLLFEEYMGEIKVKKSEEMWARIFEKITLPEAKFKN